MTLAEWRALVDKELAGRSFDKTLVHEALPGVAIQPLYAEAPAPDAAARYERTEPFRICMRHGGGVPLSDLLTDASGGADALWVPLERLAAGDLAREEFAHTSFVFEAMEGTDLPAANAISGVLRTSARSVIALDPIGWRAAGHRPLSTLAADLEGLAKAVLATRGTSPGLVTAFVSTLPYHDAGADAADELAIALSTGVRYVETLLDAGLSPVDAFNAIAVRVAVGRDTFVELCKVRALRICWAKIAAAFGATAIKPLLIHAVCSAPALTVRDPWVNMLRVTTQVFAAVIGGADLVTPNAFDETFGAPSPHGRRVARNTGLVLREESALGKVSDAAAGSYYFDALTDALARQAWTRFQQLSADGGIVAALENGRLTARIEAAWKERLDRIAKRKQPILGVSEFANLDEKLPRAPEAPADASSPLPLRRDAAAFESLRLRAESNASPPEALLVTLGTFAESRPRVGFSTNFFSAGGIRTRETTSDEAATVACICGTDERYGTEAAARARALKTLGVKRVLVAGRPGALESSLREAGVDGFIYVGCDVVGSLSDILSTYGAS